MHLQGWPQTHTYLQKQNFAPSPEGLHRIIPKNLKHPQNWTSLCPPQQGEGGSCFSVSRREEDCQVHRPGPWSTSNLQGLPLPTQSSCGPARPLYSCSVIIVAIKIHSFRTQIREQVPFA